MYVDVMKGVWEAKTKQRGKDEKLLFSSISQEEKCVPVNPKIIHERIANLNFELDSSGQTE